MVAWATTAPAPIFAPRPTDRRSENGRVRVNRGAGVDDDRSHHARRSRGSRARRRRGPGQTVSSSGRPGDRLEDELLVRRKDAAFFVEIERAAADGHVAARHAVVEQRLAQRARATSGIPHPPRRRRNPG